MDFADAGIKEMGDRLRRLRLVLQYPEDNQREWVKFLDPRGKLISHELWNAWERGRAWPGRKRVAHVAHRTGATVEWILYNERGRMPLSLIQKIDTLDDAA